MGVEGIMGFEGEDEEFESGLEMFPPGHHGGRMGISRLSLLLF